MKAQVIRAYTDRETGEIHPSNTEVELSEARARELEAGGFVKRVTPARSTTAKSPAKKTTRKASK